MPSRLSTSISNANALLSSTATLATQAATASRLVGPALGAAETSVRASAQRIAADVDGAKADVDAGAAEIIARLDSLRDLSSGRLAEVISLLDQQAKAGDGLAASLLDVIRQVAEGAVNAQHAIGAFGELSIPFQGQMIKIKTLLAEVLPSMGEVRRHTRDLIEQLRKDGDAMEQILARLGQQHNVFARQFAEMVKQFRAGKLTLDALLRAAEQIRRALPGSETSELIDELLRGLQDGEFD